MNDYVIFTDSACDITLDTLKEWNVEFCSLSLVFAGSDKEYFDHELESKVFYDRMRNGEQPKTSAANMGKFMTYFEEFAKQGKDVLYLAFSSGLSATCNFAREAANEVMGEYPNIKITVVDSLCASAGYGLLLYLICQNKLNGMSLEENAAFAENTKLNVNHWFTVDDLKYLKAGGRISATTALVGSMLNIKPVLNMNNDGKLVSVSKVRGRKAAIQALADEFGKNATDKNGTIFISHGDCIDDATLLANILKDTYNAEVDIITNIGPVIGSHSGPGTLALFFLANER
ncbi:MAG: DegV family protein [Clostridia bacterium]|nr:DegV family protein [Clostridia bacterium]